MELEFVCRVVTEALAQRPGTLHPGIRLSDADHLGQIHAFQAGEVAGCSDGVIGIGALARHDAAVLCAFLTQDTGEATGVDVGDADHTVLLQIISEGHL